MKSPGAELKASETSVDPLLLYTGDEPCRFYTNAERTVRCERFSYQ